MIIQLLLSAVLVAYLAYAQMQRAVSFVVGTGSSAAAVLGLVLVWNPELANAAAHVAGVGRGADLLLYVFIGAAAFVSLYLHLRGEATSRMVTELARAVALQTPQRPE